MSAEAPKSIQNAAYKRLRREINAPKFDSLEIGFRLGESIIHAVSEKSKSGKCGRLIAFS